jgi:hypothetical protein
MILRIALRSFSVATLLACATFAQAQLPDLRGQTFFFTGTLDVGGVAFNTDFSLLAPGGIPFNRSNEARLTIFNSGPEDNSSLSGGIKLPVIPDSTNGTCLNPTVPLTGSFNRTTGAFTMTGSIAGNSIVDFSTANVPNVGLSRIQARFTNLGITLTGTGAVDGTGNFRITNPGTSSFTFVVSATTPLLALGLPPNTCTFGAIQDNVDNSILAFHNWKAEQASVSGTVTLEDCPLANRPTQVMFCPLDGVPFTRTITPGANGVYVVPNINPGVYDIGIKPRSFLRRVARGVDVRLDDAIGISLTFKGGDANDDNTVEVEDLSAFIAAFDADPTSSNWNANADFNCDDLISVDDLDILIRNFDMSGEDC